MYDGDRFHPSPERVEEYRRKTTRALEPPTHEDSETVDSDGTISVCEALPIMIRAAAIDAIEKLLSKADPLHISPMTDRVCIEPAQQVVFSEQVRGVLALLHEIEDRCMNEESNYETDAL